jgi:uncharacterized damage-inducible protein DinB
MDPRLRPLWAMLDLNADLVLNCLDGLSEEDAAHRPGGTGNSIAFLVAHLTDTRHYLAALLGRPLANPLEAALASARGIGDVATLPSLVTLREAWSAVARHLAALGPELGPAELEARVPQRLPGSDGTVLETVAFLVQHDSYHLGQIALLRRRLGHPAMSYARRGTGGRT